MYNATSYHHSYEDTGLLCVHASADPRQVRAGPKAGSLHFLCGVCPGHRARLSGISSGLEERLLVWITPFICAPFLKGSRNGGDPHKGIYFNGWNCGCGKYNTEPSPDVPAVSAGWRM